MYYSFMHLCIYLLFYRGLQSALSQFIKRMACILAHLHLFHVGRIMTLTDETLSSYFEPAC